MSALKILGALGLCALGFALGYLSTGHNSQPPARVAAAAAAPASQTEAALRAALLEPDPLERSRQVAGLLLELGPEQRDGVLAAFAATGVVAADPEVALLVEWLARDDPEAALAWVSDRGYGTHPWTVAAATRAWARQDPAAAALATGRLRNPLLLAAVLTALAVGWDEGGHPGLVEFLLGVEQGVDAQMAIEALVRRRLVRDGAEATMRWAETLPDDRPGVPSHLKTNVLRRTAAAIADEDPAAAMAWVTSFGEGPYGRGAYRRVASKAARNAGPETMSWLSTLPKSSQRDVAVREAFRTWLGSDTEAASEWIEQQEILPWLDPALSQYGQARARHDPLEGLEWAGKISSRHLRRKDVLALARNWLLRDPESARTWIEASDWLDAEQKEQLLAPPDPTPRQPRRQPRAETEQP